MNQYRRLFRLLLLTAILVPAHRSLAASRPAPKAAPIACPTEIPALTDRLLQDLPSYANRIITRQKPRSEIAGMGYVVTAGRPEFEPLPTRTLNPNTPPDRHLHQVFFTTLEHRTQGDQTRSLQQYHWLFLAQTQYGWRLSQSYSRIGSYPTGTVLTPPRDSSQGPIAQAVVLWLRDCNAGALRNPAPIRPEPTPKLSPH